MILCQRLYTKGQTGSPTLFEIRPVTSDSWAAPMSVSLPWGEPARDSVVALAPGVEEAVLLVKALMMVMREPTVVERTR